MKTQILKNTTKKDNGVSVFSKKISFPLPFLLIILTTFFASCEKDDIDDATDSIMPSRFKVEIPKSISSEHISLKTSSAQKVDTLMGNYIYEHLRNFINAGEDAANLMENMLLWIALHNLNRPLEISFVSDEDGREKHISIIENASFEGVNWQYKLTMTDIEDGGGANAEIALQLFWNLDPIHGISILNFYNLNRNTEEIYKDTKYRVEYSETGSLNYDKHMIVSLTGFPLPPPENDIYGISTLKMFVGKTGDIVDLYGNTLHPNAQFFTEQEGFNWAFVASASESLDIAVAEVGLPPMSLDADDRYTLLEEYSIENVFRDQILLTWPNIDPELLNAYLYHTKAPGYFDTNGFVQGGNSPSSMYIPLEDNVLDLTPYNPADILNLSIVFN